MIYNIFLKNYYLYTPQKQIQIYIYIYIILKIIVGKLMIEIVFPKNIIKSDNLLVTFSGLSETLF